VTEIRNLDDLAEYGQPGATSPRGYVRARTGPGGQLKDLRIDPNALRLTAEELEAEVVTAITAAQNQYAKRSDDIMAPVLGMRPSEQATAQLEDGMAKLDALAAELDRIARQRDLAG
jgi:YbaB/EbfC DNA-binding family